MPSAIDLSRACLKAYVDKDRAAIEALIAPQFHFTSPIDNALDRATYFARCWPNSEQMEAFEIVETCGDEHQAFLIYEARTTSGKRFRNAEFHTVDDGKLVAVEVYFGWDLPHRAAPGRYIDNDGGGHA